MKVKLPKVRLPKVLIPRLCVSSLHHIDPVQLHERGIRGVMLDLDNTMLPWNSCGLSESVLNWVAKMREHGIGVCLVSNARPRRIERALQPLALPYVALARKPFLKGFRRGLKLLGALPHQCAMIGDQLFTDVLGANRLGMYSIFIQQDNLIEQRWMRGVRKLERWILRRNPRPLDVLQESSSSTSPRVLPEVLRNWSESRL